MNLVSLAHQALLSMGTPGKNTGVCCHALLQGIFPTQGWNPGLLHCRQIFHRLSHQGSLLFPSLALSCFGFWVISSVWSYSVSTESFFFTIFLFSRNLCSWFWIFYFMDSLLSHLYWGHSNWHIPLCKFKVYKVMIWYIYIVKRLPQQS